MSDFYVYIVHDRTGVPVYVGMGRGPRAERTDRSNRRNAKIDALISFGGTLPPVKIRENLTQTAAFELEKALIQFHGRADLGKGELMNLCDGGAGSPNPSAEWRARISAAHKGKKRSAETRARMSGRKQSPESNAKRSASLRGKPKPLRSAEHAARLSAANRGKPLSPETVAKRIGKKLSPESIAKREATRAANRLAKNQIAVLA
jgi:hypothetical protein